MEATFFVAKQQQAIGVRQYDDLPVEPIGEPLEIPSFKTLVALAAAVSGDAQGPMKPLRDATCQSFPIFSFEPSVIKALANATEDEIDDIARLWLDDADWDDQGPDLYELSEFLRELKAGIGAIRNFGERLYILLEDKAY
jgi:hypothetical protein